MKIGKHGELVGAVYTGEKATLRQLENLREGIAKICELVKIQAEDGRLWNYLETGPESCPQLALRKLHALIEDVAARTDLK
jgi:hypothetical protein